MNDAQEIDKRITSYLKDSKLERTLYLGTEAMKTAGSMFLPQHPLESNKAYQLRLAQSTLLNILRKTTTYLAGQVFQRKILFSENVPEEFYGNVNTTDNPNIFFRRVFETGIYKGVSIVIVDLPVNESVNRQQEIDNNLIPYMREINIEDVVGFKSKGNVLTQLRVKETVYVDDGKFSVTLQERIRVFYEDGSFEVYHEDKVINQGQISIGKIPVVIFIPGKETSIITGISTLRDLADLNLHHWQSSSDQNNILSVARVPLLFGKNLGLDRELPVGTTSLITASDENADLKYVEVTGNSIAAGREDVKDTEISMSLYGLQQLAPNTVQVTATERIISNSSNNSSLSMWATDFEDVVQKCYELRGEFSSTLFPEKSVTLNKEYNLGYADPSVITGLLNANAQGILSNENTFIELQKVGVISESPIWEDNKEQITTDSYSDFNLNGTLFDNE